MATGTSPSAPSNHQFPCNLRKVLLYAFQKEQKIVTTQVTGTFISFSGYNV